MMNMFSRSKRCTCERSVVEEYFEEGQRGK
jgi:hypothetical protein